MKRVIVFGALGNMGQRVISAITEEPEIELVGAVDIAAGQMSGEPELELPEGMMIQAGPDGLEDREPQVMVDFTVADAAMNNIDWSIRRGVHCVVGTTGISEAELEGVRERCRKEEAHVLIAPNFSIGAVLMMQFAEEAANLFDQCEIIELHHSGKVDAPSGTAMATAERVRKKIGEGSKVRRSHEVLPGSRGGDLGPVRIHSVRMDGLVAHQVVLFGGKGEILEIRHDAIDRSCFMPGVILAIRRIGDFPGLTLGLESFLDI